MPLILAVEPDRRQAHQITTMVRGRLRSELVLGDSAEAALAALGDRVPDLILTSALLSPKDEAALAEWLRRNGAAAHVQTLTVPVLETPEPPGRTGIFSLRAAERASSPAVPIGCDPAVFAEQCAAYLHRIATEREPFGTSDEEGATADAIADEPIASTVADGEPASVEAKTATPVPAAPVQESVNDVEFDLTAMLDESVFQELSEAIETVSRDSSSPATAAATTGGESWTPSSLGSPAVWPVDFTGRTQAAQPKEESPAKRLPARKPIQDEWGFFDPSQCGFSALLARLEEITHVASPLPGPNPPARSRDVNR